MTQLANSMKRRTLAVLVCLLLLGVVATTWIISYPSLKQSQVLVLGHQVSVAIREYVNGHDGAWPKSWDDLKSNLHHDDLAPYPGSFADEIDVDFSADPRFLAQQSPDEFTAIKPRSWVVSDCSDYWELESLIDSLRKWHGPN